jgi:RNA 2',3'-cyclic 3'-phosphodiesterase
MRGNSAVPSHDSIRAFFGLPVPGAQRDQLARYIVECERIAPQFRWTPAANLHLTVRFLGHVERTVAETIAERLVDAKPKSFDIELGEVGAFKRGRLARVVWMGLRMGEPESSALAVQAEAECLRAGLEPESRRYHPHLTLARARARDGAALPELPGPPRLEAWHADALILYRSRLGRAGAEYEPLRRISLG